MNELMTVREVAERLRVHPKTIYRWIEEGKIDVTRAGTRAIRFTEAQVDAFLRVKKRS